MPRSVRRLLPLLVAVAALSGARAQTAAAPDAAVPTPSPAEVANSDGSLRTVVRERVLRMTEFLDTMLPDTLGAQNVTLHFRPKFSDFRAREFVRFPIEVRYGATDRLELQAGISPFTPNPINTGSDHRWGPGEARFVAKYLLAWPVLFYDAVSVGLENRIPLGNPPIAINDHYTHVRPFIAASRVLRSNPDTTFYTNFSYDRSVKLGRRDAPPPIITRRHIGEIAPGLLYKPSEFGYFGEYRIRHFQEPIGNHLGHEVRVGTIWDVPLRRTAKWKLPGKWQVELAYRYTIEEGYDDTQGISARVNWRTTLREVLNRVAPPKSGR